MLQACGMVLTWRLRHALIVATARVSIALMPLSSVAMWAASSPQPADVAPGSGSSNVSSGGEGEHSTMGRLMSSTPDRLVSGAAFAEAEDAVVAVVVEQSDDAETYKPGSLWQQQIPYGQPVKPTMTAVPRFS